MTRTIHSGELRDIRIDEHTTGTYLVLEYDGGAVVEHRIEGGLTELETRLAEALAIAEARTEAGVRAADAAKEAGRG